jgi:hypothetical protein
MLQPHYRSLVRLLGCDAWQHCMHVARQLTRHAATLAAVCTKRVQRDIDWASSMLDVDADDCTNSRAARLWPFGTQDCCDVVHPDGGACEYQMVMSSSAPIELAEGLHHWNKHHVRPVPGSGCHPGVSDACAGQPGGCWTHQSVLALALGVLPARGVSHAGPSLSANGFF